MVEQTVSKRRRAINYEKVAEDRLRNVVKSRPQPRAIERVEGRLAVVPSSFMNAVRDSVTLSATERLLLWTLGLFQKARSEGEVRGEFQPYQVPADQVSEDGWCPAFQDGGSYWDPEHPEIVEYIDGIREGVSANRLSEISGLHPQTIKGALKRLERRGWFRIVVPDDSKEGVHVVGPDDPERGTLWVQGFTQTRILFIPNGAMNAHQRMGTDAIWEILSKRKKLKLSISETVCLINISLRGATAFPSKATMRKNCGFSWRTMARVIAQLVLICVLSFRDLDGRMVWEYSINRALAHQNDLLTRDRIPIQKVEQEYIT